MSEGEPVPEHGQQQPGQTKGERPVAPPTHTAGAMLRNLRERAGLEAVIVASALKISPQMLQALEEDRYDALPDLAFARGLAASICRNFGADPKPVLAQMPSAHATDLAASEHNINAPFRSATDRPGRLLPKYISRPLTLVVALFLLGSLLLWLWPTLPIHLGETQQEVQTTALPQPPSTGVDGSVLQETPAAASNRRRESASSAAAADDSADDSEDEAQGAAPEADEEAGDWAGRDATGEGSAGGATSGEEAAQDTTAADDMDDSAAAAPQNPDTEADVERSSAAAQEAASDDLVIEAVSDESWVSVHDASGKPLYNALLPQGEVARISGEKPLSATIGRKDAVAVQVHGQPFDHRSLGSSSVARFEVD